MDRKLLDILVCPVCKGPVRYVKSAAELVCPVDRLAFPVVDGHPVMLTTEARELPADEGIPE